MTDTPRIPESLLAHIWKGQWILKGALTASDGRIIQVRSPGIENTDSGPDFLGATIIFDDEIVTGDIELHVKSSDWRAHGHQHDPHFNSTILQVVLCDDSKVPARLHNDDAIPTLCLHDYLNGSMDDLAIRAEHEKIPSLPCRNIGNNIRHPFPFDLLNQFGMERFYVKAALFETGLILDHPDQVLYRGIMGALGYTKNKTAFETLAQQLPVHVIESIIHENESKDKISVLKALLLGSAGLLPSQCDGKRRVSQITKTDYLEDIWKSLKVRNMMQYDDWHFFRMHPKNFPSSRLMAAAFLLDKFIDHGLNQHIFDLVQTTSTGNRLISIEKAFTVPGLLGRGRARETIINVILPFSFAVAQRPTDLNFKEHILQLYTSYPKSGENQITRYLSRLFWGKVQHKSINSAQIQQGFIHLYKTFCQVQRCQDCYMNLPGV